MVEKVTIENPVSFKANHCNSQDEEFELLNRDDEAGIYESEDYNIDMVRLLLNHEVINKS